MSPNSRHRPVAKTSRVHRPAPKEKGHGKDEKTAELDCLQLDSRALAAGALVQNRGPIFYQGIRLLPESLQFPRGGKKTCGYRQLHV